MSQERIKNPEVYVTFRFIGDNIEPASVSLLLGIKPTACFKKGEPVKDGSIHRRKTSLWALESSLNFHEPFERHLEALLSQLEKRSNEIVELKKQGYSGELFCSFHFMAKKRLDLPPHLIERLSRFGFGLVFDFYQIE